MGPSLASLTVSLVVLAGAFAVIERRWAARPAARPRPHLRTDLAYWFFTPLVTRVLTRACVIVAVVALAALYGVPLDRAHVQAFATEGRGWVREQPIALQVLEVLLLGDLIAYGMHRRFHAGRWWPFHAVHHSSVELDWLAAVRLHPVNDAVMRITQVVPLLAVGFSPAVVAAYVPFLPLYAILLHANVPWTFGPLRYVLASPAFHRWHHTSEREGRDRNFAGLFPFIDLAFGTFYMPKDRQPERFGVDDAVPASLLGQIAWPFRTAKP